VKTVIFDLGRVLIDFDRDRTFAGLADVCTGVTLAELEALVDEIHPGMAVGDLSATEFHAALRERAGAVADFETFLTGYAAGIARNEAALAYALELQARPGVTVGIISNTNEAHVMHLDRLVPELSKFELVMMSNEIGMEKPDPEVYTLALELLGVDARDALYVDDLPRNVEGARAAGMAGIVHTDWAITRPQIEAWLAG
jgi:putative hydrolase of the HAD superfamily